MSKRKNVRGLTERRRPNEQRARDCWSYGGDRARSLAMVANLELLEPMVLVNYYETEAESPSSTDRPARARSDDHVLNRSLRL